MNDKHLILFGGEIKASEAEDDTTELNDIWIYSFEMRTWNELNPVGL
jgi:hypothetical protein